MPCGIARSAAMSARSSRAFPAKRKNKRTPEIMADKTFNIAIAGATGAVGETLLSILKERKFPIGELVPLASERSAGSRVEFGNRSITVKNLADYDFNGIDIAFFSAG